jgi:hypothetical protein
MSLPDSRLRTAARRARRTLRALKALGAPAAGRPARAKPAPRGERLVPDPVFVISSVRSGSTLLRVMLNSHPSIRAPHEMHLRTLEVRPSKKYTDRALTELGLDQTELEYLLWDRILHRELTHSGKDVIVDKTPGNAFVWRRLHEAWPEARYVFLLRHPASMVTSLMNGRPGRDPEQTVTEVKKYVEAVEEARTSLPGLTVRYEDLAENPEEVTRGICSFIGVPWSPDVLHYGEQDHGPFKAFIGDWSDNIKSGKVQKPRALPDPSAVPEQLRDISRTWGYAC